MRSSLQTRRVLVVVAIHVIGFILMLMGGAEPQLGWDSLAVFLVVLFLYDIPYIVGETIFIPVPIPNDGGAYEVLRVGLVVLGAVLLGISFIR